MANYRQNRWLVCLMSLWSTEFFSDVWIGFTLAWLPCPIWFFLKSATARNPSYRPPLVLVMNRLQHGFVWLPIWRKSRASDWSCRHISGWFPLRVHPRPRSDFDAILVAVSRLLLLTDYHSWNGSDRATCDLASHLHWSTICIPKQSTVCILQGYCTILQVTSRNCCSAPTLYFEKVLLACAIQWRYKYYTTQRAASVKKAQLKNENWALDGSWRFDDEEPTSLEATFSRAHQMLSSSLNLIPATCPFFFYFKGLSLKVAGYILDRHRTRPT